MNKHINISKETYQNKRILPALKEGYFYADEQTTENIIAFCAEYAEMIGFHENGKQVDNWSSFFLVDEIVLFSLIINTDCSFYERKFNKALIEFTSKPLALFEIVLELAQIIDKWYKNISIINNSLQAEELSKIILESIQTVLSPCIINLNLKYNSLSSDLKKEPKFIRHKTEFDSCWGFDSEIDDSRNITHLKREEEKYFYKTNFYPYIHAISQFRETSKRLITSSLKSGNHEPHVGMLIGFSKLYKHAQNAINSFSNRHLQFYYNDVLKVRKKQHIPDKTWLTASLNPAFNEAVIAKGSTFIAGTDQNNEDIIYEAQKDIRINKASLKRACSLYLHKDKYIAPGNLMDFVSGLYATNHDIGKISDAEVTKKQNPLPVFGDTHLEGHEQNTTIPQIGFAISSPVLKMETGQREICLDLQLNKQSIKQFINNVSKTNKTELMNKMGLSLDELFIKSLTNVFSISFTSPYGWTFPKNVQINGSETKETDQLPHNIQIRLLLEETDDPISAYDNKIHGFSNFTKHPAVRIHLASNAYVFGYSLFENLEIDSIKISTKVKKAKKIVAYNNHGQLDIQNPFYIFGSIPTNSSYLILGCEELLNKKIETAALNIEWQQLPSKGFSKHYENYNYPVKNDSFKVEACFLNKGKWLPEDKRERKQIPLFSNQKQSVSDTVDPFQKLTLEGIGKLDTRYSKHALEFSYAPSVQSGFMRLNLVEPESAFGHKTYPNLVSQVLQENAREKQSKPLPNEPYTPVIEQITVDYSASETIDFKHGDGTECQNRFMHLYPWGYEIKYPENIGKACKIVPEIPFQASFNIGFENINAPEKVNLLFILEEKQKEFQNASPPLIKWEYLSKNGWKSFDESQIDDKTFGFLKSGIIIISFPEDIICNNPLMSDGLYWVRASVKNNADSVSKLADIKTQAFEVQWHQGNNSNNFTANELSPGSINKPQYIIEGIYEVNQPLKSFGGKNVETESDKVNRVSERLAHKNRGVDALDYEKILLEEFPGVFKVKCFESVSIKKTECPGNVLLIVIPDIDSTLAEFKEPPVLGFYRLLEIKAFMKEITSPFANIEIQNPKYEQVQVRCSVSFNNNDSTGEQVEHLNKLITSFLNPWNKNGLGHSLGDEIRGTDVIAYIMNVGFVKNVTNFSMLKISNSDDNQYELTDTVEEEDYSYHKTKVVPKSPWSLLVPMQKHFIETLKKIEIINAEMTGIDELEIGQNFIIK
jgi:hypothetical protein